MSTTRTVTTYTLTLALAAWSTAGAPAADERAGGGWAATATAAGEIVIKVVEGLSDFINDQCDDVYGAAMGAAWGKCCGLEKEEWRDAGYSQVFGTAMGFNDAGIGFGMAYAYESGWGKWAGSIVQPFSFAAPAGLHNYDDEHHVWGWAKAGVDNEVRARTSAFGRCGGRDGEWEAGDVIAEIQIDSLHLVSPDGVGLSSFNEWNFEAFINGERIFYTAGSLDQIGNLSVDGDIDEALFTPTYDPESAEWRLGLSGFVTEVFITHLGPDEHIDLDLEFSGYLGSDAYLVVPEPASLVLLALGGLAAFRRRRIQHA